MSRRRRILSSLIVLATAAAVVGGATYAAFSAGTTNAGNSFEAGDVQIEDNDSGSAMFTVPSLPPGDSKTRCIRITYRGSLAAGVRLHGATSGGLGPLLNLTVTRGDDSAPSFADCSGFSPDPTNYIGSGPGVLYSGPLSSYPANWASGIVDPQATWATGEAHSYRFEVTLSNDPAGQGQTADAEFSWEARNQ
jgi:predicted ribosomally synthesized peptide with SipW-like signal peptide